jgi:hypothetical protein
MAEFPFDYEFIFNDVYDQSVFDAYPIADTDNTLQKIVTDIVTSLSYILVLQPGIRCICSFGHHDDQVLKITVINTTWSPV